MAVVISLIKSEGGVSDRVKRAQKLASLAGQGGFVVRVLFSTLAVNPVAARHFMSDAELADERARAHEVVTASPVVAVLPGSHDETGSSVKVALAWLAVGIPLLWGVWMTLTKALPLFRIG